MQLASVLTPLSDTNLALASQCGVECIAIRYPGTDIGEWRRLKTWIESFGMKASIVEGHLPLDGIKQGNVHYDRDLEEFKNLLRIMGELGFDTLCYNFMWAGDWTRIRNDVPERGGALVTAFDIDDLRRRAGGEGPSTTEAALWRNLERFLNDILPSAEDAGVAMCMHPDDPPVNMSANQPCIMNSPEAFDRLVRLFPSRSNRIAFCQATFSMMKRSVPELIRDFGDYIGFVHFRDVAGTAERFRETFHDNGPTDMAAAMRAYKEIGFRGPARPDHVPQLEGEELGEPGYTMKGRLFAYGYMRGLIQASGFGRL